MKTFRNKILLVVYSMIVSFVILIIFYPILTSNSLIFPYSIHPFDIVKDYPKIWFYIKITFCINLFITNFVIVRSIHAIFKVKQKSNNHKELRVSKIENNSNFNLLIGFNSDTKQKIFIREKGLYQNILVTGTIGSR